MTPPTVSPVWLTVSVTWSTAPPTGPGRGGTSTGSRAGSGTSGTDGTAGVVGSVGVAGAGAATGAGAVVVVMVVGSPSPPCAPAWEPRSSTTTAETGVPASAPVVLDGIPPVSTRPPTSASDPSAGAATPAPPLPSGASAARS